MTVHRTLEFIELEVVAEVRSSAFRVVTKGTILVSPFVMGIALLQSYDGGDEEEGEFEES